MNVSANGDTADTRLRRSVCLAFNLLTQTYAHVYLHMSLYACAGCVHTKTYEHLQAHEFARRCLIGWHARGRVVLLDATTLAVWQGGSETHRRGVNLGPTACSFHCRCDATAGSRKDDEIGLEVRVHRVHMCLSSTKQVFEEETAIR